MVEKEGTPVDGKDKGGRGYNRRPQKLLKRFKQINGANPSAAICKDEIIEISRTIKGFV